MNNINSLNNYYKKRFGTKVYKISLNGGMTCPNRDGKLDTRGCIFCSAGGSGDFASPASLSISEQIRVAKERIISKNKNGKFIAYFQAYTNTYAPVDYLRRIFTEAIKEDDIVGLSIATRPDCLPDDVIMLLKELNEILPVFIELGLQTIHEDSARFIRRGYELSCFDNSVKRLYDANLEIIVHLIIGLPGENEEKILQSIDYINSIPVSGIKLQLLHVLKGTDLAEYYYNNLTDRLDFLSLEEYTKILCECIEHLRPDIVLHRITGDGPKSLLISPIWSADKKRVLNYINKTFTEKNVIQGRKYKGYGT